jgi:predicted GTPase
VDRADVAILIIDAFQGLTAQDAHIAGFVVEEGRGLVLALNKWDLLAEKTDRSFDEFAAAMRKPKCRSWTSRRSCRSAPRRASASARSWSWRSTSGASAASASPRRS